MMNIPVRLQENINQVQELYHKLDGEVASFKAATSLGCLNGCGRCCESPAVFVSVLEALPLAYELWKKGLAQETLEQVRTDRKGWCIYYQPDALVPGKGRCSVYPWRPLICRLFGFSVKKDKHDQPDLVTCTTIKENFKEDYEAATRRLCEGQLQAPSMTAYAMQVLNIDPVLGKEQLPINHAIAQAIEKIDLVMRPEWRDEEKKEK